MNNFLGGGVGRRPHLRLSSIERKRNASRRKVAYADLLTEMLHRRPARATLRKYYAGHD